MLEFGFLQSLDFEYAAAPLIVAYRSSKVVRRFTVRVRLTVMVGRRSIALPLLIGIGAIRGTRRESRS